MSGLGYGFALLRTIGIGLPRNPALLEPPSFITAKRVLGLREGWISVAAPYLVGIAHAEGFKIAVFNQFQKALIAFMSAH